MTYQDPPSSQDSAQGPRRPGDRATSGYRASHQRPQGHQDVREGNPPDADRAAGAFWNPGRQQPQGGGRPPWDTRGREQDQGGGQAPFRNPGREQPQGGGQAPFGSAGREQYPGDGQAPVRNPWYQEQQPEAGWDDPADLRWPRQTAGEPPDDPTGPGGRRRGLIAGALIGVLAAAIALGVAMLVSAFISPQSSPVIAVGEAAINLTPTPLKEFAVSRFGENDKTMLLSGMYAVISLLAMGIGLLARRMILLGAIGIGAFGAFGAYVALSQPASHPTDAIPSLVGGVAGVVAIIFLVGWSWPDAAALAGRRGRGVSRYPAAPPGQIDRRKFLLAGTATAAVAAGSAVGGQILTNSRFNANASRAAVKLASPASKVLPLYKQTIPSIPGLSSFYTPPGNFYRVDTALVVPQVTTQQWSLRVHGMVDRELHISFHDLIRMPMVERDITIMCVSDKVGGNYIGNARWQGVLLSDVLKRAGVQRGISQLATTDVNGMNIGVPTDIALDGRDTMLAVGMNGVPLPQEHGFPVRLVVPGLYGYCSATKWITDMQLTTLNAFTAYWVHRGWSQSGPVKTESRIDTPSKKGSSVKAGTVMVAGVAWAQHKGVEQVEVRVDGGQWTKATLSKQDNIDTWRQWYLPWRATAGQHTLQVRATDKTGYTQTPAQHDNFPNGATGYHTVAVTVT